MLVILTIILVILGYKYFGVIGVAAATSFGMMLINIVKMIEVKVFYKIFPYEIKNIVLTVIVFCSFYFIKMINLNVQNLIGRLFANFSLSLITAALAVTLIYFFQIKNTIKNPYFLFFRF